MIDLPVYDETGKQTGTLPLDESLFGTRVRPRLLKQAIVMYEAATHQGTAATRGRGEVVGSTKKLYRQKGTGNARMGTRRTCVRRGGGVAFAKKARDMHQRMPKKMRRLARDNAILAKASASDALVIDGLGFEAPRTSKMAGLLKAVGADRGCLLALADYDVNIWKSSRNIPKTDVCIVDQLNAYSVLRRKKLLLTREAYDRLVARADETERTDE
ncbi:MAG: 50S ribosomal protein L4 [Phycisphaerales bacterium]|nr:MAG: 50S ribosomal protein L4 [Phycisphaerales bacterium]